ncbi:J domain-containing protein [Helicobacter suis]|uniref:J domain-containing protein n=1 Tax=Helicobacter suis TaxID=104628 RepID=A0A6J4D197_9HELI|nr:J domain-containing protein [Helicobacter suis]BCD70822.1 J domain-containing protein [Helicobacter suis]
MQIKTKAPPFCLADSSKKSHSGQFIEVCLDPCLYAKTSLYIEKHFPEHVRFKRTLILLEQESIKKTYLLNRLFYAKYALHPFNHPDMFKILLQKILDHAHLPIVFKENHELEKIYNPHLALVHKVEIHVVYMHSRLVFYYTNYLAREFLHATFPAHILLETPFSDKRNRKDFLHETHAHLDALQILMNLKNPHFKHAYIQFIYPTQTLHLTKQEELILKALRTLGLGVMHSKEEIKHRYLELAKLYHPDTAPNTSKRKSIYKQRFLEVIEAYKILKHL